jgi:hypothetical protein
MFLLAALLCNYGRGKCLIDIGTEGSGVPEGLMIAAEPSTPAIILGDDAAANKTLPDLTQLARVAQQSLCVAHVIYFQNVAAPCSQLTKLNERIRPQAAAITHRFDLGGVVDIVDSRVRSFEHEVTASGGLLLSVDEDSALQGRKVSKVEHGHLKSLVGD